MDCSFFFTQTLLLFPISVDGDGDEDDYFYYLSKIVLLFISLVAHLVPKLFISLVGHLVPIVTSLCRAYVTTAAFCETRRILPWFLKPLNLYKLSVV